MKKFLFVICISVLLLSSCDWLFGTGNFYAQDITTSKHYQLTANLLAENEHCEVWAETTSGVSEATARKVAAAYSSIYTEMLDVFGVSIPIKGDDRITRYYNPLEIADALTNGDGKLTILLLDIKDGYQKGVNESMVAGYFWAGDLFEGENSNKRDMIYIDTNPGIPGNDDSNSTLAHELQHMMNFVTSLFLRNEVGADDKIIDFDPMDTWIDEGLSAAAEWVYMRNHPETGGGGVSYYHPTGRWGWYLLNGDGDKIVGDIVKGNNFFVWGNRDNNPYALLDDYATVYLFFQWLRLQAGGSGISIYKDIISSEYSNYQAITKAASEKIYRYDTNWGGLLRDWLAANYINNAAGLYGYKDDPALSRIQGHLQSNTRTSVDLYPGEGVYSEINTAYAASHSMPAGGRPPNPNIYYNVLTDYPETTMRQGTLLSYNINTVNTGTGSNAYPSTEAAAVTGVAASVNIAPSVNSGRSAASSPVLMGPFRIGAGDVRRSWADVPLPAAVPLSVKSITVNE